MKTWLITSATMLALVAAITVGCSSGSDGSSTLSGLPPCSSATLLTVAPLANADIHELAPLGNLAPSGHTFPSDHMYFYTAFTGSGTASAPIVSPGAIRVSSVLLQKRTGGGAAEFDDHGLSFFSCSTLEFYFGHITTLSAGLAAQVGSLDQSCDTPYQTGGSTFQQCSKNVDIALSAGDAIGSAGGPGQGALDLGAIDHASTALAFVDPGRITGQGGVHAACPIDYFVPGVRDALLQLVAVNGVHRTVAPICGTIMQDVANTAQGRWFFDATVQEDHHLALVHTSWDPTIGAFSIGTSLPGTPSTLLFFTPAVSGRLNLDFNRVTADGNIYCYQFTNSSSRIYIRLETVTRLRIEFAASGACGDPAGWSFSAAAVTFDR